jgi:hypothetical protein
MNWIYNGKPDTTREVMVAFRAPNLLDTSNMHYTVAKLVRENGDWLLPDQYEVIAWADFPRVNKDADGNALSHHWLGIEGLKQ